MENNTNKDKWIEEILSSTDNIRRASANPYIFPKILNRIKNISRSNNYVPIKRAAIGFITIILLAIINVFVVFKADKSTVNINTGNTKKENSSSFIPSQYNPYYEILNSN
ncbi:MAG: hypothetical protein ABI543_12705 [Ignavibacteria bacterium]